MKIVGIDPGAGKVGYALIDSSGHDCRLRSAETIVIPRRSSPAERLRELSEELGKRLDRDRQDAVGIEKLYFQKNAKTPMAVGEARGVILLTAIKYARSIWEYTPLEVKLAVAGYGRADKEGVRRMVRQHLRGASLPHGDDAVDAVAIALTAHRTGNPSPIATELQRSNR